MCLRVMLNKVYLLHKKFTITHIKRFESNVKQGISLTGFKGPSHSPPFESNVKQGISLTTISISN